jgi:SAM-dependent methyltransferase
MTFSLDWEKQYRNNAHLSVWPWTDLVSLVMRYSGPHNKNFQVLELGCGAGANIPFFHNLKVMYSSLEGSINMVEKIKKKYSVYSRTIKVADFTREIPFRTKFDLVVDRASLTCNSDEDIRYCLKILTPKIKSGGKYIGIDWYSTLHSEYKKGYSDSDLFTRNGFTSGQFTGLGRVHFSNEKHIRELFSDFQFELLEHKIIHKIIPDSKYVFASWNFVAKKGQK